MLFEAQFDEPGERVEFLIVVVLNELIWLEI